MTTVSYVVAFDDGPMGLNLEDGKRYGIVGAVVGALKGQAKINGQISVGDIVAKVNDIDVLGVHYSTIMSVARGAAAPRTLEFLPKAAIADVPNTQRAKALIDADVTSANFAPAEAEFRRLLELAEEEVYAAVSPGREVEQVDKAALKAALFEAQRAMVEADLSAAEARRAKKRVHVLTDTRCLDSRDSTDLEEANQARKHLEFLRLRVFHLRLEEYVHIPYEEAKQKVEEIAKRMGEIDSADVTNPDPETQRSLREEYYRLEQDMEKYNTALILTDEYATEEARLDREWEEENLDENLKALKAIRRCMPVNIKNMSEAELQTTTSPNGKIMPRDMARKFKRTNVLELLRMDPKDIMKSHPSLLENLRVTGLTVTERRALHAHLRDIGESWKAGQNEELTKRKFEWFRTLKETFKTVVNAYNRHVAQFGPADNHPYATFGDGGIGCPLLGKQCPIKADMASAYDVDLGHPEGDVFIATAVQKVCVCVEPGLIAWREAQEFGRSGRDRGRGRGRGRGDLFAAIKGRGGGAEASEDLAYNSARANLLQELQDFLVGGSDCGGPWVQVNAHEL